MSSPPPQSFLPQPTEPVGPRLARMASLFADLPKNRLSEKAVRLFLRAAGLTIRETEFSHRVFAGPQNDLKPDEQLFSVDPTEKNLSNQQFEIQKVVDWYTKIGKPTYTHSKLDAERAVETVLQTLAAISSVGGFASSSGVSSVMGEKSPSKAPAVDLKMLVRTLGVCGQDKLNPATVERILQGSGLAGKVDTKALLEFLAGTSMPLLMK